MKTPAHVRITENTCKSFFRCLGKFAVRNDSVTQNELDSVIETWKEWGVCRETSTILLRELIAGRDSKKTFEQLFNEFLRDLTPEDRCSCDIVHAFVNMAYARKKRLPLEVRERLISIGKALSQEEFLQNFMNIYDDLCEDDPEPVTGPNGKEKTKLGTFKFG